jgi:type IV pilus assembly protein PilY1
MVNLQKTGTGQYTALRPYAKHSVYDDIKTYPLSWGIPYVGKWALPGTLYFKAEPSLLYPWSPDPSTGLSPVNWGDPSHELSGWFAFIGGGVRVYDKDDLLPACSTKTLQADCTADARCTWDGTSCSEKQGFDIRNQIFEPFMLVLDIKNGINIFQYAWPVVQQTFNSKWSIEQVGDNLIANSMNSAIILDLWKGLDSSGMPIFGQDGRLDHIFMGDLAGTFWGLRLEGSPSDHARVVVDTWQTKKAVTDCSSKTTDETCTANGCWWDSTTSSCKEGYGTRASRQPVTATPSAAFDVEKNLRLYFGTGKFDIVRGTYSDQDDKGNMAFYNITLPLDDYTSSADDSLCSVSMSALPNLSISCSSGNNAVQIDSGSTDELKIRLRTHNCSSLCTGTSDDWVSPPHPDTESAAYVDASCDGSCYCSSACYSCILDLPDPGERITTQALVAGGLVFFTTFKPNTEVCGGGGTGYLYVVDYMCRELQKNPLRDAGLDSQWLGSGGWNNSTFTSPAKAVRTDLGGGMPSRPVLDSKGEHVLIQTSDARIHRIKIDLNYKDLFKGWTQEGQ